MMRLTFERAITVFSKELRPLCPEHHLTPTSWRRGRRILAVYRMRFVYLILIAAAFPVGRVAAYEYAEVTLDYVAAKALARAQKPFHSPKADFPDFLREDKLNYDKYREIEFRHEDALWANQPLPFRVEFFHPGYIYQEPVHVNEFTLTYVQPVRFVQDWFNYRALKLPGCVNQFELKIKRSTGRISVSERR